MSRTRYKHPYWCLLLLLLQQCCVCVYSVLYAVVNQRPPLPSLPEGDPSPAVSSGARGAIGRRFSAVRCKYEHRSLLLP